MNCPKCGLSNPDDAAFCMRCGKELSGENQEVQAPEKFCYRHPKVPTQLSCGRCGRPVCTKCVILGPAGPRCPDCARQNIAVRPQAVLYDVKRSVSSLFRGGPWTIYIWILLAGVLFSAVRGCGLMRPRMQQAPESRGQNNQPAPTDNQSTQE